MSFFWSMACLNSTANVREMSFFWSMAALTGTRNWFRNAIFWPVWPRKSRESEKRVGNFVVLIREQRRSWLGHLTRKIVSETTYNVSSGTLNPTIPYYTKVDVQFTHPWFSTLTADDEMTMIDDDADDWWCWWLMMMMMMMIDDDGDGDGECDGDWWWWWWLVIDDDGDDWWLMMMMMLMIDDDGDDWWWWWDDDDEMMIDDDAAIRPVGSDRPVTGNLQIVARSSDCTHSRHHWNHIHYVHEQRLHHHNTSTHYRRAGESTCYYY